MQYKDLNRTETKTLKKVLYEAGKEILADKYWKAGE